MYLSYTHAECMRTSRATQNRLGKIRDCGDVEQLGETGVSSGGG